MIMNVLALSMLALVTQGKQVPVSDPGVQLSPYNWVREASYIQTPNPGAYLLLGFTGTSIQVKIDNASFAGVPSNQYPLVRYSIDNGPGTMVQLRSGSYELECGKGLKPGNHTLLLQYVSGYVFLDFWSPVNVVRVTGFSLDADASTVTAASPFSASENTRYALFLGDSITNGDDDTANFKDGITNSVETQDATIGYPSVVAAATKSEYGVVAYGGASWDRTAADGHTPGLKTFWSMIDKTHSRLVNGKFSPIPDDIYVNMGENRSANPDDVVKLMSDLREASGPNTNYFIIVPFSGRSRESLVRGFILGAEYIGRRTGTNPHLIDLGDNPYLKSQGPTLFSVDGQHPLAALHGQLGAQIVEARAKALAKKN
jgi:hypothetical protein